MSSPSGRDTAAVRRARQTVKNLILALGATVALIALAVVFTPEQPETTLPPEADLAAAHTAAQEYTDVPLVNPELTGDWRVNAAEWTDRGNSGTS